MILDEEVTMWNAGTAVLLFILVLLCLCCFAKDAE